MISVSITFFSLFVCGFTQYRGFSYSYNYRNVPPTYSTNSQNYRYNYGYDYGNVRPTYPVNTQNYAYSSNYRTLRPSYPVSTQNYAYQQPSCRSPCNSCQYLPCYNNYARQPYYQPHSYYNARQHASPYSNYYSNSRTSSDPYANVPVEIIDDDSVIRQTLPYRTNSNRQDEYANVPVEIIDDNSPVDFWKNIPILPKVRTSSQSNYTVTKGEVTSNTVTHNKPIKAVITRSFQPLKKQPDVQKIDFFNKVEENDSENRNANTEKGEETNEISENTTIASEEETATEMDEVTKKESEEVTPVKSWFS